MLVKYFAEVRRLAGREEEERPAAAPTVRALLRELCAERGAAFEERVFAGGKPSSTIILLVNGRNVEHLGGIDVPLAPADCVAIFPMVAGG